MGEHRLVPVRWMAPESIERRVFSSESDVFAFGIVLWEIYTFGKTPYYGLDNHEVMIIAFCPLKTFFHTSGPYTKYQRVFHIIYSLFSIRSRVSLRLGFPNE